LILKSNKGDPPPPQQAASWTLDHLYLNLIITQKNF
jgi:hypothetical protein